MTDLAAALDDEWYLREYPDIAEARADPARHFVAHGAAEGRRPNRFFDPAWYRALNPDVGTMSPVLHYARIGRAELRDPGPAFGVKEYLAAYPDVARNGMEALEHYIRYGRREGRPVFRSPKAGYAPATSAPLLPPVDAPPPEVRTDPDGLFVPNETLRRIRETFARRGSPVVE